MLFSSWLVFASIITLASISPGPNVIAVIAHTLEAGRRGALITIMGNLLALFTIALAAAIGVGAVLQAGSLFTVMKIAGGLYLVWMGIKMIKSSFSTLKPIDVSSSVQTDSNSLSYFLRAMLISYSNPKSILFLSAVFPAFLDSSAPLAPQFLIMFSTIISIVLLIHGSYTLVALRMKSGLTGTRARKLMARASGISFLGFGLGLIYQSQ